MLWGVWASVSQWHARTRLSADVWYELVRPRAEVHFRQIDDHPSARSPLAERECRYEEGAGVCQRVERRASRVRADVQLAVEDLRDQLRRTCLKGCLNGRGASIGGLVIGGAVMCHVWMIHHALSTVQSRSCRFQEPLPRQTGIASVGVGFRKALVICSRFS